MDITSRKHMEEHIRRTDRLASLEFLSAGLAHEMRNPLTGLSLMMDDLHDHLMGNKEAQDIIRKALKEIERLENLITSLLDFASSKKLCLEDVSISSVISDSVLLVRKLTKNKGIKITTEVEENIPSFKLDRGKIKQVFLNLFLNAIQAMAEGGTLSVKAFVTEAQDTTLSKPFLRVTVSDTGKGIAPQDIPYIFDPFFSKNPSGCGLGLAIVHSIVVEHGGSITVKSEEGKGTVFTIDLPFESKTLERMNHE